MPTAHMSTDGCEALSATHTHTDTLSFFLSQAFAACQYAQATELKPYDIGMIQGDTKSPLREGLKEVSPQMHGGRSALA